MKSNDNDSAPLSPADADEARVLAVLLGEASPFERETVEELLSRRPGLRAYRDHAAALLADLRDAAKPGPETTPLRMDAARREALLGRLRTTSFRDRALRNLVVFSRPLRAHAGAITAALALLLVLSAMVVPSVGVSRKMQRAESSRITDNRDFQTGSGAASDNGNAEGAVRNPVRIEQGISQPVTVTAGAYNNVNGLNPSGRSSDTSGAPERQANVTAFIAGADPEFALKDKESHGRSLFDADRVGENRANVAGSIKTEAHGGIEGLPIRPKVGYEDEVFSRKEAAADRPAAESQLQAANREGFADATSAPQRVPVPGESSLPGKLFAADGKTDEAKASRIYGRSLPTQSAGLPQEQAFAAGSKDGIGNMPRPDSKWASADSFDKSGQIAPGTDIPGQKAPGAKSAAVPVIPEVRTADNVFSTFSLNVSDVSFRLAAEAAKRGKPQDVAGIRAEEFINAQNYRDPAPATDEAVSLRQDRAKNPFAMNRDLLRLSLRTNATGRDAKSPLNLVVLLDTSGSMERSDRKEAVGASLNAIADNLRPGDKVSVIGFARSTSLIVDRMDGANAAPLRNLAANGVPAEGGTNLQKALEAGYSQLANQLPGNRNAGGRVVLLTDGAANLGDANPAALADTVDANRLNNRALDTYGIGFDGIDDAMLESLSRKGDGRYGYLNNADDAREQLGAKLAGALHPFANDVKVQVEFNPARVKGWRLVGYDNHRLQQQDFRNNAVKAAALAAAESGTALYSLELDGAGAGDVGVVRVRYRIPDTQDYREREWTIPYESAPAFADAPEGVRTAATAAFVAESLANTPEAAAIDPSELRKQAARLSADRPGDVPLAELRRLADVAAANR